MRAHKSLAAALLIAAVILPACVTQSISLPALDTTGKPGESFVNAGYSKYVLFDLIRVDHIEVEELIAEVNPDNKPIHSLEVVSEADLMCTLFNILNGGLIDRGVFFSMNKITVRGRFSESKSP